MAIFDSFRPSHPGLPFALRTLPLLAGTVCGSVFSAQAQSMPLAQMAATPLKEVVISGSRNEQSVDELPMAVDIINAKDIEEGQLQDIRDIAKSIPNVSVRRAPARFTIAGNATGREGNAGFNIRGLDGNRVLMLVDNIRSPRFYGFGANAFGRDTLSVDLVKRVELIKGPASVLYGSDGIAGLVNFMTYEPSDFLKNNKSLGGKATLSYSGDDNTRSASATVASRANDNLEWQISAAASAGNELANRGENFSPNANRTAPNPQKDSGQALMVKIVLRPTPQQKHVVTFEHVDKESDYNLLAARATLPLAGSAATVANAALNATALTSMNRNRLTWDARYKVDTAVADNLQTVLSFQNTFSREFTFEDRNTAPDRSRDTTYQERTLQASVQADKTIRNSNDWIQKLTYGADYAQTHVISLQTGLTPPAGETFPLKRFPDTVETSSALYLQNEIIGGNWSVTPGVRVDNFSIKPSTAGFPVPVVALSGSAVSPKLGVLYRATPEWSVFGNYASGFRAPNAGQVNAFFENVTSFYKTIPNGALKPEKSKNFELGARARLGLLALDVTAFTGQFTDLIEDSRRVSGAGTAANPTVFQSVNIDNATISGFEIKGSMDWGKVGIGKLSTPFSYGKARGKVDNTGLPLDSIDPAKLGVGLRYDTAVWDVRLNATRRAAKNTSDMGQQRVTLPLQFAVPAATTFDLSGQWRFSKATRVNASIANLTNQKYWHWSDVRGVATNAVALDAYTQPGRKFNVSLVTEF